jgi:hypothetical protein
MRYRTIGSDPATSFRALSWLKLPTIMEPPALSTLAGAELGLS